VNTKSNNQSKLLSLLNGIGSSERELEIQARLIIALTKKHQDSIEESTLRHSFPTQDDIKEYLKQVLVAIGKNTNNDHS
jgi:hypothetical protein